MKRCGARHVKLRFLDVALCTGASIGVSMVALGLAGSAQAVCVGSNGQQMAVTFTPAKTQNHGQEIGTSKLVLHAAYGAQVLFSSEFPGQWLCFAYHQGERKFILGNVRPRGKWLPLNGIYYLPDTGGSLLASKFNHENYSAFAAIASTDGQFLALLGGQKGATDLLLLDVAQDRIKKIGEAPLPPKQSAQAQQMCRAQPFVWGSCWANAYQELEPSIWRFLPVGGLVVSYGNDKPQGRAVQRKEQKFMP